MFLKPYALSVKAVILNKSGECLLLKRSFDSANNPGKWEFPGGKVEGNEKFDEALLREVHEETGLTISLMRVAGSAEYELPARRIAYIIMECRPNLGEVKLSKEHLEFTWASPDEIQSLDLAEQFIPFVKTFFKLDR
jgi:8-oxo-dGTP diphosphatase